MQKSIINEKIKFEKPNIPNLGLPKSEKMITYENIRNQNINLKSSFDNKNNIKTSKDI